MAREVRKTLRIRHLYLNPFGGILAALLLIGAMILTFQLIKVHNPDFMLSRDERNIKHMVRILGEIQFADELYGLEHSTRWTSLADLEQPSSLSGKPYLDSPPLNPYTKDVLRLISPQDRPQPGDIIVVPGKTYMMNVEENTTELSATQNDYYLIAIGDGRRARPEFEALGIPNVVASVDTASHGYPIDEFMEQLPVAWARATAKEAK